MKLISLLVVVLVSQQVVSWPHFAKDKKYAGHANPHPSAKADDQINTAMVHNSCCPLEDPRFMGPIISYPQTFTHEWNMYQLDDCYQNPDCSLPPYSELPPPNTTRTMPGKTWYDAEHRGGSQKESYYNGCIPIFPSLDTPQFSCDFYLVGEEDKAYMATKGAPENFGQCCILASPFHAPSRDFTRHMKYGGIKLLNNGTPYHEYGVMIEESGGPFVHGFKTQLSEKYNPPFFFYMVGVNNKWLFQQFDNFTTKPFDSEEVFKIPDSCKASTVKFCPDFDFQSLKKVLRTE